MPYSWRPPRSILAQVRPSPWSDPLIATFAAAVPSVAAVSGGAKVVIIVGATHGATAAYRTYADQAYAEAIKYTPNVVKVYSPNATWATVKAAVAGAAVVIYMGHGNGWPSPYTYDPKYTTKDGFGLNATEGAGDSNNVYYGEPYVSTLDLAPGAVVILNHPLLRGRQFGARCRRTDRQRCPPARRWTTTRPGSWRPARRRSSPTAIAGQSATCATCSRPASRSNPCGPTSRARMATSCRSCRVRTPGGNRIPGSPDANFRFYRSLVVRSTKRLHERWDRDGATGDFASAPILPALDTHGNASISTDAANLFGDLEFGSAPVQALPAGTRLRVIGSAGRRHGRSTPILQVQVPGRPIDLAASMAVTDLVPRDSAAPIPGGLALAGGSVLAQWRRRCRSGDPERPVQRIGRLDADHFQRHGRNPASTQAGTGPSLQVVWNPLASGQSVPDGTYTVTVSAVDAWQNRRPDSHGTISVDTNASQSCWRCPRLPPPSHHSLRTPTAIETRSR